ncbi:M23 family metallopeptidase [Streptomyces sp. NPDC093111]|uniref:M23 family metallopeptidase n=1 Tax=Streptomyces sp. NPDC093111 TaxID=3154978 RepID=UPI0034237AAA
MNDQHPHAGYVTDGAQTTGSFTVDPLFGSYDAGYAAGHSAGQSTYGEHTGHTGHTGYAEHTEYAGHAQYTGHTEYAGQPEPHGYGGYAGHTDQSGHTGQWDTGSHGSYATTGQWDATAWTEAQQAAPYEAAAFASYDTTGQWTTPGFETGGYDLTAVTATGTLSDAADAPAWEQAATPEPVVPQQYSPGPEHTAEFEFDLDAYPAYSETVQVPAYTETTQVPVYDLGPEAEADADAEAAEGEPEPEFHAFHDAETMIGLEVLPEGAADELPPVAARPARRSTNGGGRGRRRTPAKRSALLTVAVPSACVMGVAGIAAASVGGLTDPGADTKDDTVALAAADPASVKQVAANNKLDTQLAALSADARDFGDRASRTQERIDLRARQEADKKKREEEAARKEALRPKFLLPVKLHQLSARFGQSGVNWMSVHTGIDFPVQYGTPVMAATDGTVRTQWNSAYGNMAIVTMEDGTETWYCHLSSTKIRSGKVKAGEVIAYSGNSGNSTGPHLHFEVRPSGGAAIDPLPWLLQRGLDPTG